MKLVVNYQPFDMTQTIFVYRDGDLIEQTTTDTTHLLTSVKGLSKKFDVSEIFMIGNPELLKPFKETVATDYSFNDVNFTIVAR